MLETMRMGDRHGAGCRSGRTGRPQTARGWLVFAVVATATLLAPALPAAAAPLDDKTCEALRKQQAATADSAARQNMTRGAAWAKSNLPPAGIAQVIALIELDEKVAFRCPVRQAEKKKDGKSGKDQPDAGQSAASEPARKTVTTNKRAPEKRRAKAPANDAYVPPVKVFVDN